MWLHIHSPVLADARSISYILVLVADKVLETCADGVWLFFLCLKHDPVEPRWGA